MRSWFLLLVSLLAPAAALSQARVVQPEDLFRLNLVSGARMSPDGRNVAFVVSQPNGPKNRYDSDVWVVASDGGPPRRLTHDGLSRSPSWSPDGAHLAFVRKVEGKPQVFSYAISDGSERQLTAFKQGALDPLWSNSGDRIAFAGLSVDPPPPARIDFAAAGFAPSTGQHDSDIRIIGVERYEANGEGYTYDKHRRLWTMNADGSGQHQVVRSERGSEDQFTWSSDDRTLAFTSPRHGPPQANESDIYTVASKGGDARLLKSPHTFNALPVFLSVSRLAYLSGDVFDSAEYPAVATSDLDGEASATVVPKNRLAWGDAVLADLRMPGGPCGPLLSPDKAHLITNVSRPGSAGLTVVDLRSGDDHAIGPQDGESYDCSMSADGRRLSYVFSDFLHPPEVHVLDLASGVDHAATALNQAYLASTLLSKPEPLTITDAKGFAVQAWVMAAVGPKASGRRPTLLDIHGGPQTEFGSSFFHELQYWAGQGYNVVIVNPEGSVGYGHAFEAALEGDWGAPMFDDVSRVMDEVVRRPDVDPTRLGVIGGSYGGYATLWIISHTDRFRAAISERPASDLATQGLDWYLASSNGLGGEYAWGKPWDPKSRNFIDSPLTYVEAVHTPLMLLHSDEDTETPLDQTLDEFSALKQLGRDVVFVNVPHENHDLNRVGSPIHRVERLHIFTDWFANHLH